MQRERKRGERVWEEEEGRSIDGAWISGYFETARLPNCEMNTSLMMCGSVVMISRYEPRYSLVNRLTFFRMFFFSFFEYGNPFLLSKKSNDQQNAKFTHRCCRIPSPVRQRCEVFSRVLSELQLSMRSTKDNGRETKESTSLTTLL